jgi:hypothetical protein
MNAEAATLTKPFNLSSRLNNAGIALGNIGKTLFQDSATLKTDIAFWATLLHVIMRVQEAYITGEVQPNDAEHKNILSPEEKTYRRDQSAMTYFREIVGMTLGWGVLKVGQAWQKEAMLQKYNYHNASAYSISIKKGLGQFKDALFQGKEVEALPTVFTDAPASVFKKYQYVEQPSQELKYEKLDFDKGHMMQKVDPQLVKWGHMLRSLEANEKADYLWNNGFLRRVGEFFVPHKEAKDLAKLATTAIDHGLQKNQELLILEKRGFLFAQKYIPTVVWSIPGILFAGFWLERTTLYKGPFVKKWTVSALETLGIIDYSEDEALALAEASKLATTIKTDTLAKPLPPFPYYYSDAVQASLMYHQQLYGEPKPVKTPRSFSTTMPNKNTNVKESVIPSTAWSDSPLQSTTTMNPEPEKPTATTTFPEPKQPITTYYNNSINRSRFAI